MEPVSPHPLPSPGEPTEALPGSEHKVQVMAARAARREALFHPEDPQERTHASSAQRGPEGSRELPSGVRRFRVRRRWRYRAELWDRATKRKVSLGVYDTVAQAEQAVARARAAREQDRGDDEGNP